MTDQLPIDQLLAKIRQEASGFSVPVFGAAPLNTAIKLAAPPAPDSFEARLSAIEQQVTSDLAVLPSALADLRAGLQAQAIALALQQGRAAGVDKSEGDIRILKERVRALGIAIEASFPERKEDRPSPIGSASAPLREVTYWPRLLLECGDSFLNNAYRVLLGRNIDEDGLASYRKYFAEGGTRLEILCDITFSAEFLKRQISADGLQRYRGLYRLSRRLGRTPLRFLNRPLRGWLYQAEQKIRSSLLADIVGECRDHIAALYDNLGLKTRYDGGNVVLADDVRLDAFYLAFEDAMRGTEEEIRAGLSCYLETIAGVKAICDGPILDLGCGRGEWLSLLAEHGYAACGIDLSPTMVGICLEKGLDARHIDALTALRAIPDNSLSLVSGFHIIEHLPFPVLFAVFEEVFRVLQPGGMVLFETPNPENVLVGSHTFYHDPTHRHPLTPSSMAFLAQYHGYEKIDIARMRPYPPEALVGGSNQIAERINGHLYGPQDYAILARKPCGEACEG